MMDFQEGKAMIKATDRKPQKTFQSFDGKEDNQMAGQELVKQVEGRSSILQN
jgi:hypothetical protein